MKKFKNLVIGGIENKVFNLILLTVILITATFMAVSTYNNNELVRLSKESSSKQQASIAETTNMIMDAVIESSLGNTAETEAFITEEMFNTASERVVFLANYATALFTHPENYSPKPYVKPDPSQDGQWTAKVLFADGVDENDPDIAARTGLLANLSDIMVALCPAVGAETIYIALPEGVHLTVSHESSGWFENGVLRSYDPRTRGWYQNAVETGKLIFTDGELDFTTNVYCVECAMPVYGPDGQLQAVVGTDIYLDEMEVVTQANAAQGEYRIIVNKDGHLVYSPKSEDFPMRAYGENLFDSGNAELAALIRDAVDNKTDMRLITLPDAAYYMTGAPIRSIGWAMITMFSQQQASIPATMMVSNFNEIQTSITTTYRDKRQSSRNWAIVLFLTATALMLAAALILSKRIVKPLNTITQRISELREGDLEFKMEDAYRTGDEIEELAESFATISHKTIEYVEQVKAVTAEKERIGTELHMATLIQESMLPHVFPPYPNRKEFDIYATMNPAREVGGDFYDFFLLDDDHLCLVMADVSGKGVPAALFMMVSKVIIQSCAMLGKSAAEILNLTNEALCTNNQVEMFVTVWLGILEISTGKMKAANAGHEYPTMRSHNGSFELVKDRHGFVIGGMQGVRYKEYELQLNPGDKLFLYTDGVPEATDAKNNMFGVERMIEALNKDPDGTPEQILGNVRQAVNGFVKDAEQFDDLTMMCLTYKGRDGDAEPDGKQQKEQG